MTIYDNDRDFFLVEGHLTCTKCGGTSAVETVALKAIWHLKYLALVAWDISMNICDLWCVVDGELVCKDCIAND